MTRVGEWLPVSACAIILLMMACTKSTEPVPAITIEHKIAPQPVRVGVATITLSLADVSTKAITGARITLEGNMLHAGMAPVFATAKEATPGQYQAPLEFTMAGDWIVLLHVTLPDGQTLERQFEIKGVQPK